MLAMLRGMDGLMDIVQGKISKPEKPAKSDTMEGTVFEAAMATYQRNLAEYYKLESTALLLITNNLLDETLDKVIRFTNPKEVWDELHRLYDGVCEDHLYRKCMEFFQYKWEFTSGNDMKVHISKLKNLWHSLNQELIKDEGKELPELLLICKIMETLPESYFNFKSSWLLMSKKDRTVENLTSQLCTHEKALSTKENMSESTSENVLVAKGTKKGSKGKKKAFRCHICKEVGHFMKDCPKKEQIPEKGPTTSMMAVKVNATDCAQDRDDWYVDNGATHHITMRGDLFEEFERFTEPCTVTTANGKQVNALGKGSILMKTKNEVWFYLRNVWYVPQITTNLFSVLAAQDMNPKSVFQSRMITCSLKVNKTVTVTGDRRRYGGLFKLNCKAIQPNRSVVVNTVDTLQLYHERMGHQDKRHVKDVIEQELNVKTKNDGTLCEGCIFGKTHRKKFGVREKASSPGERIHSDVCGPFPLSGSKSRYFVLFKDEYTRYRYVYCMKQKSEVPAKLRLMLAEAKAVGHTIKEFLSDNGGEFDNVEVKEELQKYGIHQRLVMPYTPEQNGCSERENRTIVEMARAMMHAHEELPQKLWAELVNTATYILNRTGPTTVKHKSPYELWFGKKPQIKHLRIIGSTCYAHIPKQKRKKMQKKAKKCYLVGYDNDDGYRLWHRESDTIIRSRDVTFDERPLETNLGSGEPGDTEHSQVTETAVIEVPIYVRKEQHENEIPKPVTAEEYRGRPIETNNEVELSEDTEVIEGPVTSGDEEEFEDARVEESEDESIELGRQGMQLRDRSLLQRPSKFNDYVSLVNTSDDCYYEPGTYKEATDCPDKDLWRKAMDCEIGSLKANGTWVLEKLPKNRKAIPCKWIYKVKLYPDGSVDKFKARLVVKGFRQKKGEDYDQTFSPVAKMATIRAVLSLAANEGMALRQFDICTAFLYGSLTEEEIFMQQPEGYDDGSGRVCLLKKSLYGLKQAPRCWNTTIINYFKEIGFEVSEADPCLFKRERSNGKLLVALYVDDGLIAGSNEGLIDEFIKELKEKFAMTNKPVSYYLGMEVEVREGGDIRIHQTSYVKKILKRFGMENCKPVSTPMVKDPVPQETEKVDDYFLKNYRQVVGALAYLMVCTRPDIAYPVSVVSRSLENPTHTDCVRLKRMLRYLQYTPDMGILYKKDYRKGILECYSDADHGGDLTTGRSTTGVVCIYAGGAVSWLSQRQPSVAISTTEAEIVAASEAAKEGIWLARLMQGMTKLAASPVLYVDNEAAVRLAENPEFHRRTKHIRIRHFFVRELVTTGDLKVNRISTEKQLADLFTKPLARPRLISLQVQLGLHIERRC